MRPEPLVYAPSERVAADRLTRVLAESGVTALVTPVDPPFMKLKEIQAACSVGLPERFTSPMATRNPFNRTPGGEVQLTRLGPDAAGCARALP